MERGIGDGGCPDSRPTISPVAVTKRRLNRATLARQLLLERHRAGVADGVRRIVALQAQEPPSPYVALWNRLVDFDPAELDAAFADHEVVKASLMRATLHAVVADDHPAFHQAMLPTLRDVGLNDRRFKATGLSIQDADRLLAEVVEFAEEPCTKTEIWAMLGDRLGTEPQPGLWRAVRVCGALFHTPTGGPWAFGRRPQLRAVPNGPRDDVDGSRRHLLMRYLEGFGPASTADFGQFSMLTQAVVRSVIRGLGDDLVTLEGPDGDELVDVAGAPIPDEDVVAPPRLMAMWDSTMLAYRDRSRMIPVQYRKVVIRNNGDVLPTLLVDGYVAGVWRPVDEGIEVTAFHDLDAATWNGIEGEARALTAMLAAREHMIYGRYRTWWAKLPEGDVRLFVTRDP